MIGDGKNYGTCISDNQPAQYTTLGYHMDVWFDGKSPRYAFRERNSASSMGEPNRQLPKAPNEKRPLNFYKQRCFVPIEVLIKP